MKRQNKILPEGWKEVEFGEIFKFEDKSGRKAGEGLEEGKYKFFTSSSQQSKFIEEYNFEGEHLIFSTDGRAGIHHCNEKFSASNDCFVVKVISKLITKYVYYYLSGRIYLLEEGFKGAGLKHLSRNYLSSIKIIYPEEKEKQKAIVSILEKAEALKQKREQADKLTKEYLQSVFNEMFGDPAKNQKKWKLVETQELFDMKLGKMLSAVNYTGKNLKPYLRNINVQWGYLDLSDVKEMDFDEKEFIKYQLKKGDILVCEGGEVGRTAIYNGEVPNCCYQNALHRLRIKNNSIEPYYFIYFMIFANRRGLILKDTIQVTIAHFTQDKFKKFQIMLPPLELQQKFATIVEQVEQLKGKQKQSKKEINLMFDSLMQKAFNGELV